MTNRTADELRSLIDTTKESLQCIETNEVPIDEWDPFIIFIVQSKMDQSTRIEWENYLGGATGIPRIRSLTTFLETQFRILDCSNGIKIEQPKVIVAATADQTKNNPTQKAYTNNSQSKYPKNNSHNIEICRLCSENHWLLICQKFNDEMTARQRKTFILENHMCIVCLRYHPNEPCKSKYRCKKCNGEHSFKLHIAEEDDLPNTSMNTMVATIQNKSKVFATAIVNVNDKFGAKHALRVFIDMGSGGALISERAAQLLCLPCVREHTRFTGVDNVSLGKSTNAVRIQVESIVDDSFKMTLDTHVLRTIIPPQKFSENLAENWTHLNEITLADPQFLNPSQIDLLFGVDIYGFIIKEGLRKGRITEPVAQNSYFGWLVFGAMPGNNPQNIRINSISIEKELRKFWENEEVSINRIITEEQSRCVEHFKETHKRLPDGSFMVEFPFTMNSNDPNFLGESKKKALCRLFQVEKRFRRDPVYKQRYHAKINSYFELNQISLSKSNPNQGYFLPHHAVVRECSTTTKQRTVYDASAQSSNGYSLNDRCLNGPTIQPELVDIFIRWRLHQFALNADIEKMYRMIKMRPEHRKFQKILWRFSENEPIKIYELNTVTFGTKSAPYMAIATTFALADAERNNFPEAAKRVKTDFYVDDCMSGSHSIESAIELQQELDGLFKSGHFLLRKWASNEPTILKHVPIEHRAKKKFVRAQHE